MAERKCTACGKVYRKGKLVQVMTRARGGGVVIKGKLVCQRCADEGMTIVLAVPSEPAPAAGKVPGIRDRQAMLKDVLDRVRSHLKGANETDGKGDPEVDAYITGKVEAFENVIAMLEGRA